MPKKKPNTSNVQGDGQSQGNGRSGRGEGDTSRAQQQSRTQPRQPHQLGASGDGHQSQKDGRGDPRKDLSTGIREIIQDRDQTSISGQPAQRQQRQAWGSQGHQLQQQHQRVPPGFQDQSQYRGPPQGQQQRQAWGSQRHQDQQQHQQVPPGFQDQSQNQGPPQGQQQRQAWGSQRHQDQQQHQQVPPGFQDQSQNQGPPQGQQQRQAWGSQRHQDQQQQRQAWGSQRHQDQQQQRQPQVMGPPGSQSQQQRQLPESSSDLQRQPIQQRGEQAQQQKSSLVSAPPPAVAQTSTDLLPIPLRKIKAGPRPGQKIIVDVNHMALNLKSYNMKAYHYDVVVTPDKPKYMIPKAVNAFIRKEFPNRYPAFDGRKNLFSNGPLMQKISHNGSIAIVNPENPQQQKTFDIIINEVNVIDMATLRNYFERKEAPQNALLVLDVALRASTAANMIQVGRAFFTPPKGQIIDLGNGLDMWYGFFQSATLGWKPLLNVDVVHKGFYKSMPVSDVFYHLCKGNSRMLNEYIEGLKVDYEIPNDKGSRRIWRVNGVRGGPRDEVFRDNDNVEWTVFDYYEKQKRYQIKDPTLPCLWVGSRQRNILVPAELCTIASNQPHGHKLSESQTAKMVRSAATDTHTRRKKIMEAYHKSGIQPENPYLKEFGIVVSGEFEKVEARVLPPPSLEYKRGDIAVNKGVWQSGEFVNAVPLTKWGILSLDQTARHGDLECLSQNLCSVGKSVGMRINPRDFIQPLDWRRKNELISKFKECKDYQIIFVVIPNRGEVYSIVKKIAEVTAGVLTQCIRCQTLSKLSRSTVVNILLKVNAKLNGINVIFSNTTRPACLREPVMILGADVTHPGPDSNIPSIAAVVATHDPKAFQHNKIWRFQDPRQEIIQDLQNIIEEQLKFFFKKTHGQKPTRLIFFRDGVSEGQIAQVMSHEVLAIRRACRKMGDGSYQPKITFVIVQKRHHTRLFPNQRDSDDKNCNVPAGTVVDTDIVHPRETEFYLVSHASIQGTARPTKYRLVHDDANMSEDELEELTYYLCHLFARCTRSVSYPTPTYYAHVAAFRQRSLIAGEKIQMGNLQQAQRDFEIQDSLKSNSPMHFI